MIADATSCLVVTQKELHIEAHSFMQLVFDSELSELSIRTGRTSFFPIVKLATNQWNGGVSFLSPTQLLKTNFLSFLVVCQYTLRAQLVTSNHRATPLF